MIKTVANPMLPEKRTRKVASEARWCRTGAGRAAEADVLGALSRGEESDIAKLASSQLRAKIANYRAQDVEKQLHDPVLFVTLPYVVQLLVECQCRCHYCERDMRVLYETVRDPAQWTLDRVLNARGHNTDNVIAACLACNLRRKTTHHDRYLSGKQLKWTKRGAEELSVPK